MPLSSYIAGVFNDGLALNATDLNTLKADLTGAIASATGGAANTTLSNVNAAVGRSALAAEYSGNKNIANGYCGLDASGLVPSSRLPVSGSYKGTWNASTNTPSVVSGVGVSGDFYLVGTAGTTTLDGISVWSIGDQLRFNGTVWQKIAATASVSSVAGRTGAVVLGVADISGAVPTTTAVSAGTGLSGGGPLTGSVTLSIANTPVSAGSYGSASNTLALTFNAQGQTTAAAAVPIAIDASAITSGIVGSTRVSGAYPNITGVGVLTSGSIPYGLLYGVPAGATGTSGIVQPDGTSISASAGVLSTIFGSSAGTSAQGNDSRITGAAQKTANLSDLGSASTARSNLGLGSAATAAASAFAPATTGAAILKGDGAGGFSAAVSGTDYLAPGTALVKASNLSDLGSAATARSNLGLGSAATAAASAFAPATTGAAILKGDGAGGFSAAVSGTDYLAPGAALVKASNLSDLASLAAALANLGNGGSGSYITLANATAATIPTVVQNIVVLGYTTSGDGGHGIYVHAGAGAGAGKFQSADGQWWVLATGQPLNVKQFGALGDGSTDDTTAIGTADTFATSAGQPLNWAPGTYRVSTPGITRGGCDWRGASPQVCIIKAIAPVSGTWAVGGQMVNNVAHTDLETTGLGFDMSPAESSWVITAVSGTSSPYTITATGFPAGIANGTQLNVVGCTPQSFNGIYTITSSSAGFFTATTTATGTWASAGVAAQSVLSCLNFNSCDRFSVHNCEFPNIKSFQIGVYVTNGVRWSVKDNVFRMPTPKPYHNQAVNVSANGGSFPNFYEITGNVCDGTGLLTQGHHGVVSNNDVSGWKYGAGVSTGAGVSNNMSIVGNYFGLGAGEDTDQTYPNGIENNAPYSEIVGNTCYGNSGNGIDNRAAFVSITGNTCVNNGTGAGAGISYAGIVLGSAGSQVAHDCTVAGNTCTDTGGTGGAGTQHYGLIEIEANPGVDTKPYNNSIGVNTFTGNKVGPMLLNTNGAAIGVGSSYVGTTLWFKSAATPGTINNGVSYSLGITCPNAAPGDAVTVTYDQDLQGCEIDGYVTSANLVQAQILNESGAGKTIAAGNFRIMLVKPPA